VSYDNNVIYYKYVYIKAAAAKSKIDFREESSTGGLSVPVYLLPQKMATKNRPGGRLMVTPSSAKG
jgi:hypothetical protein